MTGILQKAVHMRLIILVVIKCFLLPTLLLGKVIKGSVKDFQDSSVLVGVKILINNSIESYTDLNGGYTINCNQEIGEIVFSYIGHYTMKAENIDNNTSSDTIHINDIYMFGPTLDFHHAQNGVENYFHDNGVLKEVVPFRNGRLHGCYKLFSDENKLLLKIDYRKGKFRDIENYSDNKLFGNIKTQSLRVILRFEED